MIFKIGVTQNHIDKGEKEDSHSCALALAFIDVPNVDNTPYYSPMVGEQEGVVFFETTDGTQYKALLPKNAVEFYKAFDKGEPVQPIEFEIDAHVIGPEPTDDDSVYLGD